MLKFVIQKDCAEMRINMKENVEKKKIIGKVKFRYFPNPSKIK